MKQIIFPDQKTYQDVSALHRSDSLIRLRQTFLDIIRGHSVPFAENIIKTNDWVNYLYYACLVRRLVPDQGALIIDWGGLYGHVTKILQTLGYENIFNYLLHKMPHYPLFKEALHLPTLWGEDSNSLSLETDSIDVFISSGVLEHVREDGIGDEERILKEIGRVLKGRGLLFIWNLPAKLGTSELLAMIRGKWHHQFRYWQKDILYLLRQTGFELLYLDKHKFLPGSLLNFFRKKDRSPGPAKGR